MYGRSSSILSLKRFCDGPLPLPPSSYRDTGGPRDRKPDGRTSGGFGGGGIKETFSLVPGKDAAALASITRLSPDLVEEIRRLEGQGGKARIKFDSNASNASGNVIEVGDKVYRFTWAREVGDLCDIYEEREGGIDGNGLLVESGSAWRKLNVQRVLDESTKQLVKRRSEEAEKKSKSRQSIVLEPGNPSMKSQVKQLSAVKVNPMRLDFSQMKEPPFKKPKVGHSSVSLNGASKPTFKSGALLPANTFSKGSNRLSASSPLPSPSHQSGDLVSPYKLECISYRNMAADDVAYSCPSIKDIADNFLKDPSKDVGGSHERPGHMVTYGDRPMDLQNSLIKLLKENPKGMTFKALENAIGDIIPDAGKKIEPILEKASGAYLLKTDVDQDGFQSTSPGIRSSHEKNLNVKPASELNAVTLPLTDGRIVEKIEVGGSLAKSNILPGADLDTSENMNVERNSSDIFEDKRESENSEGRAGSSSDSGSDSESETGSSDSRSDSGSSSRSRSKSRSHSESGSSSDSDAFSNSKQGTDVDVDIMMSDDEKVGKPLHTSDPGFTSPAMGRSMFDSADDHQDGRASDIVDIENEFVDTVPNVEERATEEQETDKVSEEFRRFSTDENELLKHQHFVGSLFDEREPVFEESSKHEQSISNEKNPRKSGRRSEPCHTDAKSEMTKKLKAETMAQTSTPEGCKAVDPFNSHGLSPDKFSGSFYGSPVRTSFNDAARDTFADVALQKSHNQIASGKSISYSQQTGRGSSDTIGMLKASAMNQKLKKKIPICMTEFVHRKKILAGMIFQTWN